MARKPFRSHKVRTDPQRRGFLLAEPTARLVEFARRLGPSNLVDALDDLDRVGIFFHEIAFELAREGEMEPAGMTFGVCSRIAQTIASLEAHRHRVFVAQEPYATFDFQRLTTAAWFLAVIGREEAVESTSELVFSIEPFPPDERPLHEDPYIQWNVELLRRRLGLPGGAVPPEVVRSVNDYLELDGPAATSWLRARASAERARLHDRRSPLTIAAYAFREFVPDILACLLWHPKLTQADVSKAATGDAALKLTLEVATACRGAPIGRTDPDALELAPLFDPLVAQAAEIEPVKARASYAAKTKTVATKKAPARKKAPAGRSQIKKSSAAKDTRRR